MSLDRLLREARTPTVYDEIVRLRRLLHAARAWRKARANVLAVGGPAKFAVASDDLSEVVRECETP